MTGRYEQLQAFVEVVEQRGFTAAADKLDVDRSVVSRRLRELEKRLGVRLLNRTTRQISLTSAGEQLYQASSGLLLNLDEIEQQIAEQQVTLSGRLKIAAPLSFGYRHLSRVISDFAQAHPDIELELDLNDREIDLVAEGYDMAVRVGPLKDSSLVARDLGAVRFATVASPGYLAQHGRPDHPSELLDHDGLFYSNIAPAVGWRFWIDGQQQVFMPRVRLRANNGDLLARAAMNGLGIYQCPTFLVNEHLYEGLLTRVLQSYNNRQTRISALFPPGRMIPRRARALADYLQQQIGEHPPWDRMLEDS